jgi:hypothetical protein
MLSSRSLFAVFSTAVLVLTPLLLSGSGMAAPLPSSLEQVGPTDLAPQTINGRGQQVSARFSLDSGLSIFRLRHGGNRNFIVHLLDQNGAIVEFLTNEIGAFDGSRAAGIQFAGTYVLEVQADGDWSVTIEQPRPSLAPTIPLSFTGRGKQVTPFFTAPPGLKVVTMQHSGKRNFIVHMVNQNGRTVEFLANAIGPFGGSKATGTSGIHLFNVEADGDWTIDIR